MVICVRRGEKRAGVIKLAPACARGQRSGRHLVGEPGGLTDDAQRQRLLVAQSLQVAADPRPLDLPLTQVIRKPGGQKVLSRRALRTAGPDARSHSPASEGLQVCFEHEQPSLDAAQAGLGVLLQVGRGHQQALHALPDELLLLLQARLSSCSEKHRKLHQAAPTWRTRWSFWPWTFSQEHQHVLTKPTVDVVGVDVLDGGAADVS